ncbi:MAG: adenylyltransferase/cytidyltransferase family protein [Nitrososphaerota archaeon]
MAEKTTVLTSGAFDIVHPGHIKMLWEAKKLGGKNSKLVVVLARDETIKKRKNRKPLFDEKSRIYIVSNLKPVDQVILGFKKFSFDKVIKKVRPDIVVFGYDQIELMREFEKFVKERNLRIKIYKARRYRTGSINSTTDIIKKLKKVKVR